MWLSLSCEYFIHAVTPLDIQVCSLATCVFSMIHNSTTVHLEYTCVSAHFCSCLSKLCQFFIIIFLRAEFV